MDFTSGVARSAAGLAARRAGFGIDVGYFAAAAAYSPMFDFEVRLVLARPSAGQQNADYAGRFSQRNAVDLPGAAQPAGCLATFLQRRVSSPLLKAWIILPLLIQMVAARMGITALPHWVVESVERAGLVVAAMVCGAATVCRRARRRDQASSTVTESVYSLDAGYAVICRLCGRGRPFRYATAAGCNRACNKAWPVGLLMPDGKRLTSSPAGTYILFMIPSVPASARVAP